MALFSERYGYVKPRDVLVRECINIDIQNAICSAFDNLRMNYNNIDLNEERNVKIPIQQWRWRYGYTS